MKIPLEIHSGDVNNDSGPAKFFIHFTPESLIHISPESLSTISRNDYSHAPEYAVLQAFQWRPPEIVAKTVDEESSRFNKLQHPIFVSC